MKVSGLSVLFLIIVMTVMFVYSFNRSISSNFFNADMVFHHNGKSTILAKTSRKLKEDVDNFYGEKKSTAGDFRLDDYRPIDPVPSSKASIKPGPIEHGSPIGPYIPKPPPPTPSRPSDGGST